MSMNRITATQDDHLARFMAEARRFPMLTADQERSFTNRWREDGDQEALTQLLGSHLRLVIKIASRNRGYGLPLADLIAEGNAGLMQAVERFDPDRGYRFATYALWWIRAAIQEYILHSWSLVKIGTTAAQKKLFFNLRKIKGQIDAVDEGDLNPEQVEHIAKKLGVTHDDVISMNRRMAGQETSLNAPMRQDGDGGEWQDWLVDEDAVNPEVKLANEDEYDMRMSLLEQALATLNEREQHIITERRLKDSPATLEELSQVYGVSRERVRQIEVRAFEKLQKAMKRMAKDLHTPKPEATAGAEA